jgi:hypothetical protein
MGRLDFRGTSIWGSTLGAGIHESKTKSKDVHGRAQTETVKLVDGLERIKLRVGPRGKLRYPNLC